MAHLGCSGMHMTRACFMSGPFTRSTTPASRHAPAGPHFCPGRGTRTCFVPFLRSLAVRRRSSGLQGAQADAGPPVRPQACNQPDPGLRRRQLALAFHSKITAT
jgi:hypothetical protein